MPSAEVVSVGTELLLGQVLDTNSQFLAVELAKLGVESYFRSTVGDNKPRIRSVLRQALERCDILITTGGLGPTADDLTTECIAELLETELIFDEEVFEHIKKLFASRNFKMPDSNRKQAMRPVGAEILSNSRGTAPGIIWKLGHNELAKIGIANPDRERLILTFPGVPRELHAMWREVAAPYIVKNYGSGVLWSIELKHIGIGESALAEQFAHLLDLSNPTVAPYAGHAECRLRVTAKAATEEEARALAAPVVAEIESGSGSRCYGFDSDTLESVVGRLLKEKNLRLSLAESCTGGLISQRLTDVPGSSKYIALNMVTYSNQSKTDLLKVKQETIAAYGAVSPQCAEEMAKGALALGYGDIALSVTGIAGPDGGTDEKPIGTVYLGLAAENFYAGKTLRLGKASIRSEVRFRTAQEALNMVRLYLLDPALLAPQGLNPNAVGSAKA
ncbi:MAG TPA: competence/damage-inducible protein A [Oculatellaceae cyanobacterium]